LQDRGGESFALRPCEPRKTQSAPLLGHGRGGVRPRQTFGGAKASYQVGELGEWRLYRCCRRCCGGGEQVKLAGGESAHSGSIAGNRMFQDRHLAMTKSALQAVLQEMRSPQAGLQYYALMLTADEMGKIQWAAQSSFFDYKSRTPIIERRVATPVVPDAMISLWRDIGTECWVVSSRRHLLVYLQLGGNVLMESSIATKLRPDIREPVDCRPVGVAGFVTAENLSKTALQRAPARAVRMKVLKRDGYRCRVCGRRPAEYVDVELHVHHIRPWGDGGATIEDNLMTLCGTCHGGLDPHFEWGLFDLLGTGIEQIADQSAYRNGVERYRVLVREVVSRQKV
jgi:hypothetical protein